MGWGGRSVEEWGNVKESVECGGYRGGRLQGQTLNYIIVKRCGIKFDSENRLDS